ncbi:MAG TPA: polyprenyl synthetase family protein [Armatimonadota bacterium]
MTPPPDRGRALAAQTGEALVATARRVDALLPDYLPPASPYAGNLGAALGHTLQQGKRVRPLVVMQAAATCGLPEDLVLPTACGFELLHTATLIHDDLPSIDNADLRRGLPASHVAFGESTAVLAGDALIIAAYAALARQAECPQTPADRVVRVIAEFCRYVGAEGVLGGEAADIAGEQQPPELALLSYIHHAKTAALFVGAARAGAILAGAPEAHVEQFGAFAEQLGLLFQVTDDLLDATGDAAALGKPAGADAAAGKQTYPAVLGLEGAQRYAQELADETLAAAAALPARPELWSGLVWLVLLRQT